MPWLSLAAAVLQAWYPGQEAGNAIADVIFGDADPGLNGRVRYKEGLFTGCGHYDKAGIKPLFPLGFGLSYTSFALSDMQTAPQGDSVQVAATITNIGARNGSTVLQVHVAAPATLDRPHRRLRDFAKCALAPGQAQSVTVHFAPRGLARLDVAARCWRVDDR